MATQVWPVADVPVDPLAGSYAEQLVSFNAEFAPDVGPPSRWPRSAAAMMEVSFRMLLTADQREDLLTFYVTTCKSGSLPFTLADPITGTTRTWFWMSAPGMSAFLRKTHFSADIRIRRFVT